MKSRLLCLALALAVPLARGGEGSESLPDRTLRQLVEREKRLSSLEFALEHDRTVQSVVADLIEAIDIGTFDPATARSRAVALRRAPPPY